MAHLHEMVSVGRVDPGGPRPPPPHPAPEGVWLDGRRAGGRPRPPAPTPPPPPRPVACAAFPRHDLGALFSIGAGGGGGPGPRPPSRPSRPRRSLPLDSAAPSQYS